MHFSRFQLTVQSKVEIVPGIFIVKVIPSSRFSFLAGQYISFKISDKVNRSYSIASAPSSLLLEFLIDTAPQGPGSQFVLSLNKGDVFEAMGPFGFFTLEKTGALSSDSPLLFIGTGTGIAPLKSMITHIVNHSDNQNRQIALYFGLRDNKKSYYFKDFYALSDKYPSFVFNPVISRPDEEWGGLQGYCQEYIVSHSVINGAKIYICGRNTVIDSIKKSLTTHGYPLESIFYEKFG